MPLAFFIGRVGSRRSFLAACARRLLAIRRPADQRYVRRHSVTWFLWEALRMRTFNDRDGPIGRDTSVSLLS